MPANDYDELLRFALDLAAEAANVIMPLYRETVTEYKADGSEVTEADRNAELRIRELVEARYPQHGVLGEEFGQANEGADRTWIIDPIDGTQGFTLGLPLFGTLLALTEGREPVVGVISLPALGEVVYAARGLGCWYRRTGVDPVQVHVRDQVNLSSALVSTTGGHYSDIEDDTSPTSLIGVARAARRLRFGGDCAQHALVCRGRLDAAIDTEMKPWDTAALVPCVEEAGGVTATVRGVRDDVVYGGSLVSASGPALLEELVNTLRR